MSSKVEKDVYFYIGEANHPYDMLSDIHVTMDDVFLAEGTHWIRSSNGKVHAVSENVLDYLYECNMIVPIEDEYPDSETEEYMSLDEEGMIRYRTEHQGVPKEIAEYFVALDMDS